jgi:hypothetical protein
MNFGMGFACLKVSAFTDHNTITHQHTADPRVGVSGV